jgi:drug/metabolite transporter (DMT)-like permease
MKIQSGYLKIVLAAFIWGTIGVFARWSGLSPLGLSFFRLLFATVTLSLILPRDQRLMIGYTKEYLLIFFSGILFALDSVFFFVALQRTTMSNAVFPYYMQPVILALLTSVFLKEKLEHCILAFTFSLGGVALLLAPSVMKFSYTDLTGVGFALAGALCLSVIALFVKVVHVHASTFVYYEMLIASACLLPFIKVHATPSINSLLMAGVIGLVHTALAYIIYYDGLKTVKIQYAATLTYFAPVVAAAAGYFIFRESVSFYTVAGGLLIVINGIFVIFKR